MPRILIVSERFWPEDFIINDVARQLAADGFKVTVLTQTPSYPKGRLFSGYRNRPFSEERWQGLRVRRFFTVPGYKRSLLLKLVNYASFILAGSFFARFIGKSFDKVFIYQTGPLTVALPGIVAARRASIDAVIWTQDVWPDSVYAYGFKKNGLLSAFLDYLVRRVYASCSTILVSCEGFAAKLARYARGRSFEFVPNYPIADFSRGEAPAKRGKALVFAFTGNVGKMQNLENVLLGFDLALKARPGFGVLRIVGDGSALPALKALAKSIGAANVEMPGRMPLALMPDVLAACDVAIISLKDDPIFALTVPSKFQAYLSARKPMLCIMRGEVAKSVSEEKLGIVADPSCVEGIKDAFLAFADLGRDRLAGFSINAGRLLDEKYNRASVLRDIADALK
jgi:hypothetical protein